MQTGVPLWVPLTVALLGVLGIIAGQVVSSWREDRRWQQEREREDLRWQRERERDNLRWQRDREQDELRRQHDANEFAELRRSERERDERRVDADKQQEQARAARQASIEWREKRTEQLVEFIGVFDEAMKVSYDSVLWVIDLPHDKSDEHFDSVKKLRNAMIMIQIISTREVREAAAKALEACELFQQTYNYLSPSHDGNLRDTRENIKAKFHERLEIKKEAREALIRAARVEISVDMTSIELPPNV